MSEGYSEDLVNQVSQVTEVLISGTHGLKRFGRNVLRDLGRVGVCISMHGYWAQRNYSELVAANEGGEGDTGARNR